ncbi:MAG TPA: transcriptional regulator [Chloroflexota bacterium]|nr:transcriptional regulator [Chloroflexota bacterium]
MQDLEAIALLQDSARRSLYEYVIAAGHEVSRNEAAAAVGLQRTLAAFHLDRLAGAGLLEVAYRRLSSRSGPGAGRPAKLYRRAAIERAVAVPPREYAQAANVLAAAIERAGAEAVLYDAAREEGIALGRAIARPGDGGAISELARQLTERGYEPYTDGATVRLRNCPFHSVAQQFPVVACGMNLALLDGMLAGAELAEGHEARLQPRPGECCVALISKTNTD